MEPAGRKFPPTTTTGVGGGGGVGTGGSSSTVARVNHHASRTSTIATSTTSSSTNHHLLHHSSSNMSSHYGNSNHLYDDEQDTAVMDGADHDYVHVVAPPVPVPVPPVGVSSRHHQHHRQGDAAMAVKEEQRPPTLALEEEDLYIVPHTTTSSTSKSSSNSKNNSNAVKKRGNGLSKMLFWKRNSNVQGTTIEDRMIPAGSSSGGSVSNSAHGSAHGGSSGHGGGSGHGTTTAATATTTTTTRMGDRDSVSILAVPPTTIISVTSISTPTPPTSTQNRPFHRRATMGSGTNTSTTMNNNNNNNTRPETHLKPVKIKPTKVSLSSLLQLPQSTNHTKNGNSSSIQSNASVTSLLALPPTTMIDTTTTSTSTSVMTTKHLPLPRARNHLHNGAVLSPPSKASSMINLNATRPCDSTRNVAPQSNARSMMLRPTLRDPPTASEAAKATTVIGGVSSSPITTITHTSSVETLWRERQHHQHPPEYHHHNYHNNKNDEPPESPTPSQYSSKNSIATIMSIHSSSTTAMPSTQHKHNKATTTTTTSKTPLLSSYQTNTPITKHYNISQQILHAFELYYTSATAAPPTTTTTTAISAHKIEKRHTSSDDDDYNEDEDDNALYVITAQKIGVQYIETVLIEIPKHGYYYSKKHRKERLQSSINAVHVGHLLLHLIEQNETNNDHHHPTFRSTEDPPESSPPTSTKEKDRNHIQNLIGIALTHIEQVTNAVCGTATDTTTSKSQQNKNNVQPSRSTNPPNKSHTPASTSPSSSSMAWLEQQYNHSVSILSLSTVCCGHDLADPSPTTGTSTAASTTAAATMLSPAVVSSILPILQGRESKNRSSANISTSSKTNDRHLTSNKPDPVSSSSSSVFLTIDPEDVAAGSTLPSRYVPRQNTISSLNSHQSSTKTTPEEALMLEKALFLSGLEVSSNHSSSKNNHHHHHPDLLDISTTSSRWGNSEKRLSVSSGTMVADNGNNSKSMDNTNAQGSSSLELATLAQLYHEDFDSLQQSRRVRISYADTYQGRYNESTNGCTVIAPLICIHHLTNNTSSNSSNPGRRNTVSKRSDPGLTDSEIVMIIDQEAPSVLSELRQSLGLAEHAFLIPVDVHDYLLDQGQLSSSQFINVTGGNILNDEHLQAFISILEKASNKDGAQRIGATLFFHEHVLAICKLHRNDPTTGAAIRSWYDIIDSLPNPATLRRCNESMTDVYHRIGMFNTVNVEECMMNNMIPKTARIRCLDVDALCAVLKWYACSKFTAENISYIDQYPWDEQTCDFDPRVFQAFIWGSCTDDM